MDGPTSLSPQEELDSFQKAVALHPAGILVSVSKPNLFKDAIDAAVQQGIPVVAIDADAQNPNASFCRTDNFRAGQESARRMASLLKGQGQVVLITVPGQLNLDERVRGVFDELTKFRPQDRSDHRRQGRFPQRLRRSLRFAIQETKSMESCAWSFWWRGRRRRAHRVDMTGKIAIVSFDKDPETFDWIDRGASTRRWCKSRTSWRTMA